MVNLTKDNYFDKDIQTMVKNYLLKLEMAIDTVLELQGFKHDKNIGWLDKAEDFNDWIECVIEFQENIEKTIQSHIEIECNIEQFYNLVEFAKVDILKNICNVY